MTKRSIQALVRLSDEERAMVETLSKQLGLSMSDVIRQALRAFYSEKVEPEVTV